MQTIRIACVGADTVEVDHLHELQGDLKSLTNERYEMLKKEFVETGFAFPIHVWKDTEGKLWIVGGHQRKRVLTTMRNDGFDIPPVPIDYVEAKDIGEARRRVLQDVSQYGDVDRQGLYEFLSEAGIGPGELAGSFHIPDIDIPAFNAEFFFDDIQPTADGKEKEGSQELSQENFQSFDHKCPRCGFEFD